MSTINHGATEDIVKLTLTKGHGDDTTNKEDLVEFKEVNIGLRETKISFQLQIKTFEDVIWITEYLGDEFWILWLKKKKKIYIFFFNLLNFCPQTDNSCITEW